MSGTPEITTTWRGETYGSGDCSVERSGFSPSMILASSVERKTPPTATVSVDSLSFPENQCCSQNRSSHKLCSDCECSAEECLLRDLVGSFRGSITYGLTRGIGFREANMRILDSVTANVIRQLIGHESQLKVHDDSCKVKHVSDLAEWVSTMETKQLMTFTNECVY